METKLEKLALVISKRDNVGTAKSQLDVGDRLIFRKGMILIKEKIPFGFKFALRDISIGEPIIKFSKKIGIAKSPIKKGELVHVHNISSYSLKGTVK